MDAAKIDTPNLPKGRLRVVNDDPDGMPQVTVVLKDGSEILLPVTDVQVTAQAGQVIHVALGTYATEVDVRGYETGQPQPEVVRLRARSRGYPRDPAIAPECVFEPHREPSKALWRWSGLKTRALVALEFPFALLRPPGARLKPAAPPRNPSNRSC